MKIRANSEQPLEETRWWEIIEDCLPHGSGFNYGWFINDQKFENKGKNGRWLPVNGSHYVDNDRFCGWLEFQVSIKSTLDDFELVAPEFYQQYEVDADFRSKIEAIWHLQGLVEGFEFEEADEAIKELDPEMEVTEDEDGSQLYDNLVSVFGVDTVDLAEMVLQWEFNTSYFEDEIADALREAKRKWNS